MTQPLTARQFDGAYGIFTVHNKFPNAVPIANTSPRAAMIMVNSNTIPPPIERRDLARFLEFYSEPIKTVITRELRLSPLKVSVTMHLHLYNDQSKHLDTGVRFDVNRTTITNETDIDDFMAKILIAFDKMAEKRYMTAFALLDFNIHFYKYNPFATVGSSYIPTPMVNNRCLKGIVNIKNDDNKCFYYSLILAQRRAADDIRNNENNPGLYDSIDLSRTFIFDPVRDLPMSITRISGFETTNQMAINVYSSNGNERFPVHISKQPTCLPRVHLFYIHDDETGRGHYCTIVNFSVFCGTDKSGGHSVFHCEICLQRMWSKQALETHTKNCSSLQRLGENAQAVTMPCAKTVINKATGETITEKPQIKFD